MKVICKEKSFSLNSNIDGLSTSLNSPSLTQCGACNVPVEVVYDIVPMVLNIFIAGVEVRVRCAVGLVFFP